MAEKDVSPDVVSPDIRTCALEGCDVTWVHAGTTRKYCSRKHTTYALNHSPKWTEARKQYNAEWKKRNPDKANEYMRKWRAKRREENA